MKTAKYLLLSGLALALVSPLTAGQNVIFIHGRSPGNNHCSWGTTDVGNYWSSSASVETSSYVGRYFAGYHGDSDPRSWDGYTRNGTTCSYGAQDNLDYLLAVNCQGANTCKIICHSAGCYAVDYYLSNGRSDYGDFNVIKTKIVYVQAIASASGGSELSNVGSWADGTAMVDSLTTGQARSFNHNNTAGRPIKHLAGYDGWACCSAILPGEDDGAVAFHSSCGRSATGSHDDCEDSTAWTNHSIYKAAWHSTYSASSGSSWGVSYWGGQSYDRDHTNMKNVGKDVWNYYN